jgi:mannose-6-phosphate isomerase-like protein (cupin superfamily)
VVNPKEVEDSAPKFGYAPDLEARFATDALGLQRSGVSLQRLAPEFRLPFGHDHEEQEELYVVVAGGGRAKLDDDLVELRQWDALRVPPEVTRQFEAGPDGMEILAFGAPRENANDVGEMKPGWWSD